MIFGMGSAPYLFFSTNDLTPDDFTCHGLTVCVIIFKVFFQYLFTIQTRSSFIPAVSITPQLGQDLRYSIVSNLINCIIIGL
jgi:hypothetical protein